MEAKNKDIIIINLFQNPCWLKNLSVTTQAPKN